MKVWLCLGDLAATQARMLRLHMFGGCFLTRDGTRLDVLAGQRKSLALLAIIAAAGKHGVSRDTVLAYLWPESDEDRARTSLKQLVHSLRQQSSAPAMFLPTPTLRPNSDVITSDVAEFRDAIRRGDDDAAVGLYTGPFLNGFYLRGADDFEKWASTERASLARDFARALEALAMRATAQGDVVRSVDLWRRFAQAEPLSVRAATGLMVALDAAGERAAALQHARAYQQLVLEEVGGAPDASVAALATRLQSAETVPRTPSEVSRSSKGRHGSDASRRVRPAEDGAPVGSGASIR